MDDKDIRRFISFDKTKNDLALWLKYSDEVTFTSWEPTIHPKIVDMVKLAKDMGYKTIQIISNGRKYKDKNFVLDLIKAWITDFAISVHWYNSILHDSIVRKKWSFQETLQWMIHISQLKSDYNIVFNTSTTVIRQNYKDIYRMVYFLEKFPLDSLILNVVIPQEEAIKNKDDILVKYSLMAKEFEKIVPFQKQFHNIYINGFPYCLWENLNDMLWFREPVQFEQSWEMFARHSENHSLELKWEIDLSMINWKSKREECKKCMYNSDCEWVWSSYINLFGWYEFAPKL